MKLYGTKRSADFQSGGSQGFQPAGVRQVQTSGTVQQPADWKSAIQQIGNLRYAGWGIGARCTLFTILTFLTLHASAAEVDLSRLPPPAQKTVDFTQDIKPIFEQS